MAKSARAGELRTRIMVFDKTAPGTVNKNGFLVTDCVNVFGDGATRRCKWLNAYGREVYDAKQVGIEEPATLTMRYASKVTPTSIIYRVGDGRPYEVIGVNDVEDRHIWLELKVKRKVAGKI